MHQAAHVLRNGAPQAFYPASTKPLCFPSAAGAPTVRDMRGPAEAHADLQVGAAGAVWRRWAPCLSTLERDCAHRMHGYGCAVCQCCRWQWLTPSPTPPRSCWLGGRAGRRRPGCGGADAGQDVRCCGPHAGWFAVRQVLHCVQLRLQPSQPATSRPAHAIQLPAHATCVRHTQLCLPPPAALDAKARATYKQRALATLHQVCLC